MKRVQEAITGAAKAGADVLKDQRSSERDALRSLLLNFRRLKVSLENRLIVGITDFKRFSVQALLADVDRLIAETETSLQQTTADAMNAASDRGQAAVDQPMKAAGMIITPALPGLDADLVGAAFGNTVDLLSVPMKQFGTEVKAALRRVSLAGDNRFEEIQALRDKIGGKGFDNAQYRAERIIRTEVGRVFNQAQYDRMVDLSKTFPFLRKGWRSTKDSRTRLGHREAGAAYARGQGIKIADLFTVNVYDERPGAGGKKTGTATMRFPLDPETKPAGKVAAGATIMCRCNGFVDMDPQALAAHNAQRVAQALGVGQNVPTAPVPPAPPPVVPAPAPKPKPVRPRPAPKPKVIAPPTPVPVPVPVQVQVPQPVLGVPGTPQGPKVSAALDIPRGPGYKPLNALMGAFDAARKAMALIDSVHGDVILPKITFGVKAATRYYGVHFSNSSGTLTINLSRMGTAAHPLMTVVHESGHWLDNMGMGKGGAAPTTVSQPGIIRQGKKWVVGTVQRLVHGQTPAGMTDIASLSTEDHRNTMPELKALKAAMGATAAYQRLKARPSGLTFKSWRYYLTSKETFARAYAQYIATKTQDPVMLAELRKMQAGDESRLGIQWSDQDFVPVMTAFDALFKAEGWIR